MNLLKFWLRLLLHSKKQRLFRGEAKVGGPVTSSFEAWIRSYRQRLNDDADGIRARELVKVVYLSFALQNTVSRVFRNLSIMAKLELEIMMQAPKALCCFTHGGRECSLCFACYILS